jgi:hypothetical protein
MIPLLDIELNHIYVLSWIILSLIGWAWADNLMK